MPLVTGFELLQPAMEGGYAVGAFNANNLESVKAVIDACEEKEAPVFLQVSQGAIKYAGLEEAAALVIAADTLVFLDEHVLSKPADKAEARAMLRRLSGNTHQVVSGVAVLDTATGYDVVGSETTDVTFRTLTDAEIDRFVEAVNPVDRAGAYTVDGPGSLIVARYDGCYQNVLGLPVVRLDKLLRGIGHSLFDLMNPEQARFL